MTKIGISRLRKLANHLLKGKLGHEVFDFSKLNADPKGDAIHLPKCGTNGCAIGECPELWPKDWKWGNDGNLILLKKPHAFYTDNTEKWFNLTEPEATHLFFPGVQEERYGGKELDDNATKEEVAENILIFCKLKEEGKI